MDSFFHKVIEQLNEGIIIANTESVVSITNSAALNILNRKKNEVIGKSISEILPFEEVETMISSTLQDGAAEVRVHIITPQKTSIHLKGRLIDDSGKDYLTISLTDLSRIRRLKKIRKDFVANVSHELKTPITAIKGFAETLVQEMEDSDHRKRFAQIIEKQADRLSAIISDLLTLSRLERGDDNREIIKEAQPLSRVIGSAIEICKVKAEQKNINITFEADDSLQLELNSSLMEQALINLIDNAVKYSDENTTVLIRNFAEKETIKVTVKDQGAGIKKKYQSRLFERFFRVDKGRSRELGGTGLGLAIVKHVTNLHSGSVSVESKEGKGSTFTLSFEK